MYKIIKFLRLPTLVPLVLTFVFLFSNVAHAAGPIVYIGLENSSLRSYGVDKLLYDSWNNQDFIVQHEGKSTYLHNWISTSMSNEGSKSFGVELKTPPPPTTANWQDDPNWAKQRIELEMSNRNYHTQHLEQSRYYGFAVYIHPNSTATIEKGAIFMQAWQRHETNPGKHPPFSLRLEDDSDYKWSVNVSRDSSTQPEGAEEKIYVSPQGLARGVWHEFIVWFKPSVTSSGAVRVWHNGTLAVSQTSQRNFGYKPRSSSPAVYTDFAVRVGAYRRPVPDRTSDLTLLYDQIKFGTSYSTVDP